MERYRIIEKIGAGTHGQVYLVEDTRDNKRSLSAGIKEQLALPFEWVMKVVHHPDDESEREVCIREALTMLKLNHPCIVGCKEAFIDENRSKLCIVMEKCSGGELRLRIQQQKLSGKLFPESLILDWFVQMVLALEYIHGRNIMHRDFKTENLFLRSSSDFPHGNVATLQLGDFGSSRVLEHSNAVAQTFVGTPFYMSPELLRGEPYDFKSDVWALGCVLYELMSLKQPFSGENIVELAEKVQTASYEPPPELYSLELRLLLKRLLAADPSDRLSTAAILETPIVSRQAKRFLAACQVSAEEFTSDSTIGPPSPTSTRNMQIMQEASRQAKRIARSSRQSRAASLSADRPHTRSLSLSERELESCHPFRSASETSRRHQRRSLSSASSASPSPENFTRRRRSSRRFRPTSIDLSEQHHILCTDHKRDSSATSSPHSGASSPEAFGASSRRSQPHRSRMSPATASFQHEMPLQQETPVSHSTAAGMHVHHPLAAAEDAEQAPRISTCHTTKDAFDHEDYEFSKSSVRPQLGGAKPAAAMRTTSSIPTTASTALDIDVTRKPVDFHSPSLLPDSPSSPISPRFPSLSQIAKFIGSLSPKSPSAPKLDIGWQRTEASRRGPSRRKVLPEENTSQALDSTSAFPSPSSEGRQCIHPPLSLGPSHRSGFCLSFRQNHSDVGGGLSGSHEPGHVHSTNQNSLFLASNLHETPEIFKARGSRRFHRTTSSPLARRLAPSRLGGSKLQGYDGDECSGNDSSCGEDERMPSRQRNPFPNSASRLRSLSIKDILDEFTCDSDAPTSPLDFGDHLNLVSPINELFSRRASRGRDRRF